jgi:hypothetical protein
VLEEELEAGRRQWTLAWRRFAKQWTQPQLLKLADAVMGGRYLHSSQISGFATGKLREPAPKVFVVIGRLNLALANDELPPDVRELGEGKQVLKDKDRKPLDSVGCFRAFTGQIDLGLGTPRIFTEGELTEANIRLGRLLRSELQRIGVNFIDELPKIVSQCGKHSRAVLLGQPLGSKELVTAVSDIEELLIKYNSRVTAEEIWEEIGNEPTLASD